MSKVKYIHGEDYHNLQSPQEIVPYIVRLLNPKSVVDIGCGIGTFLYCFKKEGVEKILGIDGPWVDRKLLHKYISPDEFKEANLEAPIALENTFDLVVCLEVVEHLSEAAANTIVQSLVNAGKVILLSAAIPLQGGQHHINEQWLSYWEEKFNRHDYVMHDVLRPIFWNNPNIFWWYRQNMIIVAHKTFKFGQELTYNPIQNIVHPELFTPTKKSYLTLEKRYKSPTRLLLRFFSIILLYRYWRK